MATVNSRVTVVDVDGMDMDDAGDAINTAIEALELAGFVAQSVDFEIGTRGGKPKQLAVITGVLPAFAGNQAALGLVKVATKTVGHADLTAVAVSESLAFATVPPEGSLILGCRVGLTTPFTGGSVSACVVDIGVTGDVDCIIDGANVFAAAVDGEASAATQGIARNKLITGDAAARTLRALFIATGDNVVNLSAGACRLDVLYV